MTAGPGEATHAVVLNALRHHGGGHSRRAASVSMFDPSAQRLTASRRRSLAKNPLVRSAAALCSTPYGITAEVTFPDFEHQGPGSPCSTPYGITAEVTMLRNVSQWRANSAQRLTASRRRSPMGSATCSGRTRCAQRLTASRRRSHYAMAYASCLVHGVLNALRHHGGGHFTRPSQAAPCSLWCSTPYGITAEVTLGSQGYALGHRVLNALRHHGGGHAGGTTGSGSRHGCSTPYGITAEVTPEAHAVEGGAVRCAQRLTASRRRSRAETPARPPASAVLNALRHHGGGHKEMFSRRRTYTVLNALRHHGGGHDLEAGEHQRYPVCSTPYGITAEVTHVNDHQFTCFEMCSTPYGITAEVTTPRAHRWSCIGPCSTPYGITAEVTGGPWKVVVYPGGAQRLTASRRRSHPRVARRPRAP